MPCKGLLYPFSYVFLPYNLRRHLMTKLKNECNSNLREQLCNLSTFKDYKCHLMTKLKKLKIQIADLLCDEDAAQRRVEGDRRDNIEEVRKIKIGSLLIEAFS
ncbi:hypothetical protein RYX36_010165 [Vicia faba]